MIGFNGGLIGGSANARATTASSAAGVWTLNEQRRAKLALLWPTLSWEPSLIATALWLDAADTTTVTTVSGAVSQWNDKSGNGRNATQSTAANRPAYTTAGLDSKNVLTFDGTNDNLTHTLNASPAPHSVFAVAKRTSGGSNYQTIVGTVAPSSAFGALLSAKVETSANWGSYINSWASAGSSILDQWRVIGIVSPTSTSGSETYVTDGSVTTVSYASRYAGDGTDRRAIGGEPAANNGWLSGQIAEIVIVTSGLSESIRQKLEGYLAHKWALTANLPAGHPYKTVPPPA